MISPIPGKHPRLRYLRGVVGEDPTGESSAQSRRAVPQLPRSLTGPGRHCLSEHLP